MKFTYKPRPSLQIEFEAGTGKEAFKALAEIDETYGVSECGNCESKDIVFVLRSNKKGHEFPELKCRQCHHKLAFGQNTDGKTIYPRLRYHDKHPLVKEGKAKEGEYIPNGGWERFGKVPDEE